MEMNGSVFLTEGEIGGNIKYVDGQPIMDTGLESSVYISLFSNDFWGNEIAENNSEKLEEGLDIFSNSKATNQTRLSIIARAQNLLNWMITDKIADKIEIDAVVDISKIQLIISVIKNNLSKDFKYYINWVNQVKNPAMTRLMES